MLAVVVLRARWLLGLFAGSASRGTAAVSTSTAVGRSGARAVSGEVVSQLFVWFFVLLGLMLLGGLMSLMIAEIKLRREIRGPRAARRAGRTRLRDTSPWYQ